MSEYFEYWMLPPGTDDKTTRIVDVTKDGKYLLFHRDDGKICKYDLSTGDVIGFRGKPVKSLSSQLKDLTANKLIEITSNPVYKKFLEYVHERRPKHRAWLFISEALPDFIDYEQYFTSGFTNFERRFSHGYSEVPKGLFKFCEKLNLTLDNKLFDGYTENPDVYNLLLNIELENYSKIEMMDAMMYGDVKYIDYDAVINPQDLTMINGQQFRRRVNMRGQKSYFVRLVEDYRYNARRLITYIDQLNLYQKRRTICRDLFDYADMMNQLYDDFEKYPEKLSSAHKRAVKEYNRIKHNFDDNEYSKRNVLEYECEIDGFKFIYPRKTSEIQKEGKDQHNCVSTYINRVLAEECHIMFMRPVEDITHSYITLEIRRNRIVQAKRKFNQNPSREELEIIQKWNEKYKDFVLTN